MRSILRPGLVLACGLVATAPLGPIRADEPAVIVDKETLKRWEKQFQESLGWYKFALEAGRGEVWAAT